MRNVGRGDKVWENLHTFGFEEGRSATEIPSATRLMEAAAQECGADLGLVACSMDVKQAFDNVSPESFSLVKVALRPSGVLLVVDWVRRGSADRL